MVSIYPYTANIPRVSWLPAPSVVVSPPDSKCTEDSGSEALPLAAAAEGNSGGSQIYGFLKRGNSVNMVI